MLGKTRGVNRGRGNDQLEIWPTRQELPEIAQQKINIQAAFVRLINDDGVVTTQQRIPLGLGKQDSIGHQFDRGLGAAAILKSDLVAYPFTQRRLEFISDTTGH